MWAWRRRYGVGEPIWWLSAQRWSNDRQVGHNGLLPELFTESEWKTLASRFDLTLRQAEVARWLCRGHSKIGISHEMRLSPHTVRMHTRDLFKKLKVRDRIGVPIMLVLANRESNV